MIELKNKKKRIKPLLRVRKLQLDQEALALMQIQQVKKQKMDELMDNQRKYLNGVEQLNQHRQSMAQGMLLTVEESVDHIRNVWHLTLHQLKEIEQKERAQMANVLVAQRNLQAIEKLEERYGQGIALEEKRKEQQALDETAARLYMNPRI